MNITLDRIDLALLDALQKDGRASNKELAAIAGLAPSSTHGRLKRLREAGVLRGIRAILDPTALGIGLEAFVFLRLATHGRSQGEALWNALTEHPEVRAAYYLGGDDDILLHVLTRDAVHLRSLVLDRIADHVHIGRVRTELVFKQHHSKALPVFVDVS